MNELSIHYKTPKMQQMVALVAGYYFLAGTLGLAVYFALKNQIDILFYLTILGLILAAVLICVFSFWQPKPLLVINNDVISLHFTDQKLNGDVEWENIKQINIGISYLKIQTITDKIYAIDLNDLKYNDLKAVKSKIVEMCEMKKIHYEND